MYPQVDPITFFVGSISYGKMMPLIVKVVWGHSKVWKNSWCGDISYCDSYICAAKSCSTNILYFINVMLINRVDICIICLQVNPSLKWESVHVTIWSLMEDIKLKSRGISFTKLHMTSCGIKIAIILGTDCLRCFNLAN